MIKSCCAPRYENCWSKTSSLAFYRFPANKERRALWIAAVKRESWEATKHSVLCSAHFIGGRKSKNPLSPTYVPSVFNHVSSPQRWRAEHRLLSYNRRNESHKRRAEAVGASPCKKVVTKSRESVDVEEMTDSEHETALVTVVMAEETWTLQAVGTISTATMNGAMW